jgi:hypothetical protein
MEGGVDARGKARQPIRGFWLAAAVSCALGNSVVDEMALAVAVGRSCWPITSSVPVISLHIRECRLMGTYITASYRLRQQFGR